LFRSCDSRKRLVERREIDLLPVVTRHGAPNARSLDKSGCKSIMNYDRNYHFNCGGEYSSTRKIALLKQLRENFYIDCPLDLNDRARTLYSQHGIPASQRNGRSELLIVLEYALEDTCPWRGQRHPPTFEHMHRDSSNRFVSRVAQGKKPYVGNLFALSIAFTVVNGHVQQTQQLRSGSSLLLVYIFLDHPITASVYRSVPQQLRLLNATNGYCTKVYDMLRSRGPCTLMSNFCDDKVKAKWSVKV
ncbi:hypothetical protein ALC62_05140, partial [Cyphomyrmex costatus]